jgi:hypothetical protein
MNTHVPVRDQQFDVMRVPMPVAEEGVHTLLVVVLRPEPAQVAAVSDLQVAGWDEEPTWEDAECL